MPPRAVLNAKPTVRVDSQAFATINELMVAMEMHEQEGGLSSLELRFSNTVSRTNGGGGYAFEDDRVLKLGARIAVYGGDQTEPREIFAGVITGLEVEFPEIGPPELVVLAEDGLQRGRMTRRTAVYRDMTLADIARQVAQRMGLEARVDGFTSRLPVQVQLDESDLAFLRRLLARYDGDAQAVGAELHVSDRGNIDRGAIELELHKGLRRARIVADLAHQVSKITVTGWNIEQGIRIRAASQGQNLGPGSGNPGSHLLQDAIGEREEHIGHLAVTDETEARALADVAFDRRARRFVRVDGTAVGNPFLRVGSTVALSGLGDRFDNTYYVVQACHSFNAVRGYETDFQAECAFLGGGGVMRGHLLDLPAVGAPNATYLGEVVAVNDPKNLGRVQLRLLSFDGPEGHDAPVWARVAFPFAGNERGAFFLPDVGDEVLVSFVNGDSRFPVVIGSFYHGNAGLPETLGGNGDRVDRWTITGKAGSRIAIVEEQSGRPTISLTTPGGVEITLTDDGSKIRLKTTGSSIEIEPSGIKVKTSGKVEVNASEVEITSGQVTVNSALSNFSGVVKCDVMQATTVIATTYTPGAGNIW